MATRVGATGPVFRSIRLETRRALWAYAFLLVPLLFFLTIRLGPAFSSLYISLHEWNILSPSKPFVGLQNFQTLLHDPKFTRAAGNTLRYVVAGVPTQIALGLVVALLLQRINRFRGLFRALYFMPFVTPIVAAATASRSSRSRSASVPGTARRCTPTVSKAGWPASAGWTSRWPTSARSRAT